MSAIWKFNDHVGKKETHASRTKEHLRFVSVAFDFHCECWKAGYVSEPNVSFS